MKVETIICTYREFDFQELHEEDKELIMRAIDAMDGSYAPYSHFHVGAAVRMAFGAMVSGSNQENAAFPSGLCAERTALFYAQSKYPDGEVESLAIAARNESGNLVEEPIAPCGACRQVMLEVEKRYGRPLRILLFGHKKTYEILGVKNLMPLTFGAESME